MLVHRSAQCLSLSVTSRDFFFFLNLWGVHESNDAINACMQGFYTGQTRPQPKHQQYQQQITGTNKKKTSTQKTKSTITQDK